MKPLERVLAALPGSESRNGFHVARCPAHDDHTPSLSVSEGDDGRVLLNCFAGCDQDRVLAALEEKGIAKRDLFPDNGEGPRGKVSSPADAGYVDTSGGCTLDQYAQAKQLPRDLLESVGVGEIPSYNGHPAVRIPYLDKANRELAVRFRTSLKGDNRFRWRRGSKTLLYRLWRSEEARKAGYAVLVEGESDCHALWRHGIPAYGVCRARPRGRPTGPDTSTA